MTRATAQELINAGAVQTMGLGAAAKPCLNVPLFIPFSVSLAAGLAPIDLLQSVPPDADFYWRGVWFDPSASADSLLVRFSLATGYYLSNVLMPLDQINLEAITPELKVPAGGRLLIEANNISAGTLRLKVVFIGVKRYYLDAVA